MVRNIPSFSLLSTKCIYFLSTALGKSIIDVIDLPYHEIDMANEGETIISPGNLKHPSRNWGGGMPCPSIPLEHRWGTSSPWPL